MAMVFCVAPLPLCVVSLVGRGYPWSTSAEYRWAMRVATMKRYGLLFAPCATPPCRVAAVLISPRPYPVLTTRECPWMWARRVLWTCVGTPSAKHAALIPRWLTVSYAEVASRKNRKAVLSYRRACHCSVAMMSAGQSGAPPLMKPKMWSAIRPLLWSVCIRRRPMSASTILKIGSRHVTGLARRRSFGSGATSPSLSRGGASPARMRLAMTRRISIWESGRRMSSSMVVSLPVFPFFALLSSSRISCMV